MATKYENLRRSTLDVLHDLHLLDLDVGDMQAVMVFYDELESEDPEPDELVDIARETAAICLRYLCPGEDA